MFSIILIKPDSHKSHFPHLSSSHITCPQLIHVTIIKTRSSNISFRKEKEIHQMQFSPQAIELIELAIQACKNKRNEKNFSSS